MSNGFNIAAAQIVALFMETIFYGIFLVTFGHCIRVLLFTKDGFILKGRKEIRWIFVCVALFMFIFSTLNVSVGLLHNLNAFVDYDGSGGATGEFDDISYWPNVMKSVNYVAQTLIGDGTLIYRFHIIFNKNWRATIIPMVVWVADVVCGTRIIWVEITTTQPALISESSLTPWIYSFLSISLVVNIAVTGLIVQKLWKVRSQIASISADPGKPMRIIRIIIDSGFMYTVSVVIFFATGLAGSNSQYPVSNCVVQIVGITFNLIIIRVDATPTPASIGNIPVANPVVPAGTPSQISPLRNMNDSISSPTVFDLRKIRTHSMNVVVEIHASTGADLEANSKDDDHWGCVLATDSV